MYKRILKLPLTGQKSIFLFGPRGTGKTSYIKSLDIENIYIDLLDYEIYDQLSANPGSLRDRIPDDFKGWVIIDEVQKIPNVLNEVHRLIELKKYRFILTGSSARSLRRKGVNLLGGRALLYHMHPLTAQELGAAFNVQKAVEFGLLPDAIAEADPAQYLKAYVQIYLREEVQQEGLTRNIGTFNRFLDIASFSQGQVLNYSEISREMNLKRSTVVNYFDILDDLLLSIRILPFTRRAKRKVIAHQKFYFFDAGVFRSIRPMGPFDLPEEADGAALETLFLQSVRAINDYFELEYSINFWRTVAGDEVDFVIYGPKGLHAFEIKRSATITPKALKGLQKFGEDYPEAKLHLLYLGDHKRYHGPITVIPMEEALRTLPELIS